MDIRKIIANNVYILRTMHDLTQQEFADKLAIGFTRAHISRIESGANVPSADFIKSVSGAFNVTSDWIIGSTGKEIPNTPDTPTITNVTTREIDLLLNFRSLENSVQNKIVDLIETIVNPNY